MGQNHHRFVSLFLGLIVSNVFSDCPDGFIKHHGSCYIFFGNLRANWIDAKLIWPIWKPGAAIVVESCSRPSHKAKPRHHNGTTRYCQAFGADLAVIETPQEQNFIHGYLQRLSPASFNAGDFWIDGSDLIEEGTWRWVSKDTEIKYFAWAPGNPSNTHNYEHCLEIELKVNVSWNDDECEKLNNIICEKPSTLSTGTILG